LRLSFRCAPKKDPQREQEKRKREVEGEEKRARKTVETKFDFWKGETDTQKAKSALPF
jgi:hypothetical protein